VLAPLVPCAGRMSVLVFIAGALYRAWAPLVLVGLLAIDVGVIVLSARLLGRATLRDHAPGFIMELPLYHLPNARTIALYTWQQIAEFLRRAGSVILLVSLLIWALSSAPNGVLETSWLANIGQWLAPFGRLMGMDWRSLTSLLASVAAKEQALATLAILTGSAGDLSDALPKLLSPAAGLAFLIVQMLFIPCVATIAALKAETRSWRLTASVVAYLAILSFGLGIVVYQVLRLIDWGV